MKITITANIETTLTRAEFELQLQDRGDEFELQLQDRGDVERFDEALEDLFARFRIPALIHDANVELAE